MDICAIFECQAMYFNSVNASLVNVCHFVSARLGNICHSVSARLGYTFHTIQAIRAIL